MAPLKSLEGDYPIIDSDFQKFCALQGILTVEDFLVQDLNALVVLVEKQPNSKRLKEGIDQICSIVNGMCQPWLNGVEMLRDSQQNKHVFSIGCDRIDSLLHGGLREGFLTELVGPSSSGKTQVCLQAAASAAMLYAGGVVFLDSGNSCSPRRIAEFIRQNSLSTSMEENHITIEKAMSSISCYRIFDIFTLLDVLHQLESKLKRHALMISAGYLLKKLAHQYSLSVLVTNHMVGGEGGLAKPALGESWKSIPHVRLLLSRDQESNICRISVLK
ncbi:hypothetical protein Ancab_007242 [Ancistrocladus abbreviatus]